MALFASSLLQKFTGAVLTITSALVSLLVMNDEWNAVGDAP